MPGHGRSSAAAAPAPWPKPNEGQPQAARVAPAQELGQPGADLFVESPKFGVFDVALAQPAIDLGRARVKVFDPGVVAGDQHLHLLVARIPVGQAREGGIVVRGRDGAVEPAFGRCTALRLAWSGDAFFGAELPLPTKLLMGLSEVFLSYWYVAAVVRQRLGRTIDAPAGEPSWIGWS